MKKMIGILFFVAVTTTTAAAGVDTSGGGNSVVCFDTAGTRQRVYDALANAERAGNNAVNPFTDPAVQASIKSVEALDLYLHELPRGRNQDEFLTLFDPGNAVSSDQVLNHLLERLKRKNSFADDLRASIGSLRWIAADGVARITDTGLPLLLQPTCMIAQTAYRRGDQIFFDRHLYTRMDLVSQAILVLHEALYAIAKDEGAPDAFKVYEAVSLLIRSDQEIEKAHPIVYAQKLLELVYATGNKHVEAPCPTSYPGAGPIQARAQVSRWGSSQLRLQDDVKISVKGHEVRLRAGATGGECKPSIEETTFGPPPWNPDLKGFGEAADVRAGGGFLYHLPLKQFDLGGRWNTKGITTLEVGVRTTNFGHHLGDLRVPESTIVWLEVGSIHLNRVWADIAQKPGGPWLKQVALRSVVLSDNGQTLAEGTLAETLKLSAFKKLPEGTRVRFDKEGRMTVDTSIRP